MSDPQPPSDASVPKVLPKQPVDRLALKDKLSIAFAATSLIISVTLFWINVIHVKHELQLSVSTITTYPNGTVELGLAFLNTGNREAAIIRGGLLIWQDDFELADGWHKGGWNKFYSTGSFGGRIDPFAIKPGEVKLVAIKGNFDLGLVRAQIWDSRLSADKRNRTIALGIGVDTLDGRGIRYHAEFPTAYWRFTVREEDQLLGMGRGDYALPQESIQLFMVGIRPPYLPRDSITFTKDKWDLLSTAQQDGVKPVSVQDVETIR